MSDSARERDPLLCSLLESRRLCLGILGAGVLHVGLTSLGASAWPCPLLQFTGIPCPGCGLGRGAALLLRGEWSEALRVHAFAPLLAPFGVLLVLAVFLREAPRAQLIAMVARIERLTIAAPIALVALLIYWLLRFTLDDPHLASLGT